MSAIDKMKPVEILLVEDNPGDVDLARDALEKGRVKNNLHVVMDGEAAMAFLKQQGAYEAVPRPDLILLDLNLPKKDGREILAEIKVDPSLKRIPVVVLTTSQDEADVLKSYNLHANCYLAKPIQLDRFFKMVQSIEDFWLSIVVLPPREVGVEQ